MTPSERNRFTQAVNNPAVTPFRESNVILEVGADRILYSVDYPYEDVVQAGEWLDKAAISDSDRTKIARANAQKLFRI